MRLDVALTAESSRTAATAAASPMSAAPAASPPPAADPGSEPAGCGGALAGAALSACVRAASCTAPCCDDTFGCLNTVGVRSRDGCADGRRWESALPARCCTARSMSALNAASSCASTRPRTCAGGRVACKDGTHGRVRGSEVLRRVRSARQAIASPDAGHARPPARQGRAMQWVGSAARGTSTGSSSSPAAPSSPGTPGSSSAISNAIGASSPKTPIAISAPRSRAGRSGEPPLSAAALPTASRPRSAVSRSCIEASTPATGVGRRPAVPASGANNNPSAEGRAGCCGGGGESNKLEPEVSRRSTAFRLRRRASRSACREHSAFEAMRLCSVGP